MSNRELKGVPHPYDPIGKDGKSVRPLSYRNVLTGSGRGGYEKEGAKHHFVKPVAIDEYPLNTSHLFSVIPEKYTE